MLPAPRLQIEIPEVKTHDLEAPLIARVAAGARNPYRLERILGVILWLAFFAGLFSLGE